MGFLLWYLILRGSNHSAMWLKSVHLKNIKSFADSGVIEYSPGINVLVGPNNAGKSTILRAISLLQPLENARSPNFYLNFIQHNLRPGAESAEIEVELAMPEYRLFREFVQNIQAVKERARTPKFVFAGKPGSFASLVRQPGAESNLITLQTPIFHQREPNNFIYPYFSRRKPTAFQTGINPLAANMIEEVFEQLPCKIDRLSNPDYPSHGRFREVCWDTLGLKIAAAQYEGGKQAGLTLSDASFIPIDDMGEGTLNILILLAHLCFASGKLFLMEEIENDLHPRALKKLLDFIIEKAESNQFIISTHSNIVTRYLGTAPKAKVFSVDMTIDEKTRVPTSSCKPVSEEPEERVRLLDSLGYDPFDLYLYRGYLVLEESTAERIIRDFFLPFLVPNLQGKLRTIAASGDMDVGPRLIDLMRLFTFIHTSPQYRERAWAVVDGGNNGKKLISDLRQRFKTWPETHFKCFKAQNFEEYYPPEFKEKVAGVLALPHGQAKQKAKGRLAEEVLAWAMADPVKAKAEFKLSAKEVLDVLGEIAAKIA